MAKLLKSGLYSFIKVHCSIVPKCMDSQTDLRERDDRWVKIVKKELKTEESNE